MNLQRFKVPADGNCLFWSVAMGYLLPAINHDEEFADKFKKLSGSEEFIEVQELLKTHYNSALNFSKLYADSSPLKKLVCVQFRAKVIDTLRLQEVKDKCLKTITIYDFKESRNEKFVTSGKLLTELINNFNEENIDDINFSRMKDEEAVFKMMSGVFEAIENNEKQEFLYDFYLQCMMENTSSWGGHHEILAMTHLLQCAIYVETAKGTNVIKWNDSDCKLHLSYDGAHYDFGLETGSRALGLEEEMIDALPPINLFPLKRKADDFTYENDNKKRPCYSPDVFHRNMEYKASGLKRSFHGVLYQLKLLFLILRRALDSNLSFRLATEMDAAEKFDDLVFLFQDENDEISSIFLQAKHKQNESETITYKDLLNQEDGEFSLKKYFMSYVKMKNNNNNSELTNFDIKKESFVIITNIDFDEKTVKLKNILKRIEMPDPMLEVKCVTPKKNPTHYHIIPNDERVEKILKECSRVHQLAKELVVHVFQNAVPKKLTLTTSIFKEFHKALCKYVLDKGRKKFRDNFIKNKDLSEQSKMFRDVFYNLLPKYKKFKNHNETELEQSLMGINNLLFSDTFGDETAESKSELPSDIISDEDVKDFFGKLVFAVDQANEEELRKTIEKEVGLTFNLSCSKDIADQVQRDLIDWFKQKQGMFITPETGKAFFDDAQNLLYNRIGIGICALYDNELNTLSNEIDFNNLELFSRLLDFDNRCYVIKSDEPLLTLVKIYKCKDTHYQTKDSYVIVKLTDLLQIENYVLNAFGGLNSNQLLVIHCDCADNQLNELNIALQCLFSKLFEIIKDKMKKLLVVVYNKISMQTTLTDRFCLENDESNFNDLSSNSQKIILDKFVMFQSNLIKLSDLNEDKNQWNEILDGKTIGELITHERLEIGSAPLKLSQLEAAFVKSYKEIKPKNLLSALKLDSKEPETEIFIFTEIIEHNNYFDRIFKLTNITLEFHKLRFASCAKILNVAPHYSNCTKINIILNEKEEINAEIFKKICYHNSEKYVYWLEIVNDKFYWLQVYDPHFYIRRDFIPQKVNAKENPMDLIPDGVKYNLRTRDEKSDNPLVKECDYIDSQLISEEELANADERVVLIVAEPGMGKTTTLTRLSQYKLKDSWVIRLNLRDYQEQILSLNDDYTDTKKAIESTVTFLLSISPANYNKLFTLKLLKHCLTNNTKRSLLILFDGYDEISIDCQAKLISLIKYLNEETKAKLWISSRKEHTTKLENELSVRSTLFKEFSDKRRDYIRNFYQVRLRLRLNESDCELVFRNESGKFDLFFKALLEKVDKVFNERLSKFMGIPLQLRLLAECFLPEFEGFISNNYSHRTDVPDFDNLDILHFYQRFIRVKYGIYFQEKTRLSLGLNSESGKWLSDNLNRMHQRVALKLLFPDKIKSLIKGEIKAPFKNHQFEMDSEQEKELMRVGILHVNPFEEKLEFIHRTFAEYFVAEFILKKLRKPLSLQLREAIQKLLLNLLQDYSVIPMFLNEGITEADLSRRKVVTFDKCLHNLSKCYLRCAKLTELILSFFENKTWILKHLDFRDILDIALNSTKNTRMLTFIKSHYDIARNILSNNKGRFFYNATLSSVKTSNVKLIMNAIKCYPKIIEEVTRDYYLDDLCEFFEADDVLWQLIRQLKNEETDVSKITSYEVEANKLLRSFKNKEYRNNTVKPYRIKRGKDLDNAIRAINIEILDLGGNVKGYGSRVLPKFDNDEDDELPNKEQSNKDGCMTRKQVLTKYQQIKKKLEKIKHERNKNSLEMPMSERINVTFNCVSKLVENGNNEDAKEKLQSLSHIHTDDLWLKRIIIETFKYFLFDIIKDKQETYVFFLFDLFKSNPIIIFNLFYFGLNAHLDIITRALVNSVECKETKELMLHLLSSLKASLSDDQIKIFGRDLLSAIENEDNEVMKEIIESVEHNSEDIMRWMREQLSQNNSKIVLKDFFKLLAEHGESTLNEANEKDNLLFIQRLNNCLKMFPNIFKFLIFNAKCMNLLMFKYITPEMFRVISKFLCDEFPQTACCWAILADGLTGTPISRALKNNDVTAIRLLFDVLNPYPTILKNLIILPPHLKAGSKTYLHLALIKCETNTLEAFLSQLSRNRDVMEYVLEHFVSNEEEKLQLYESMVEKNPDSLLIFLDSFKRDINTFKKFSLPADKSAKPAIFLAGERGCKEVMDMLLRALKSEKEVLWQLLTWSDPVSGKTVLHRAAERGYREIVDAILSSVRKQKHKLKTLFHFEDKLGHTLLDCAILSERQIVRNEFNIELRRELIVSDNYITLIENFGNGNSIKCLLDFSTDLKNIPMVVNLILVFAKSFNKVELMIAMFENEELSSALEGMNVTKDDYSYNLFYSAIERDSLELVNELINKGYDVNCTNGYGYTPLMKAIDKYKPYLKFFDYREIPKDPDIIETLLNAGADIYFCNMNGESAYSKIINSKNKLIRNMFMNK